MSITTLDGVIAGMKPAEDFYKTGSTMEAIGVLHSHFYANGRPGAAVAPSDGMAGAALTSYSGQIPFSNPVSGNTYIARFQSSANYVCSIVLADRLWHNSGTTLTTLTEQAVNSVTFPARDRNASSNGENIMVAIEVSTITGNAGAITNTTLNYTNSLGTLGRTGTIPSFPATAQVGTFVPFTLQAGDTGVKSVQGLTLGTSYISGAIHLVAYRILTKLDLPVINSGNSVDAITGGFVRLYDNTVPFIVQHPTATTATAIHGQLIYTQG
jgi:hypothetical protein